MPLDSLATVLLLPRPWFWLSTRTSSVAELDFHLVAFKRNLCFVVLCRGENLSILLNICVEDRKLLFSYWLLNATNYVAHSLLRIRSVHLDPLLLVWNVFFWNAFVKILTFSFLEEVKDSCK